MENIRNKIIYQLSLRTFTPEGTLKAATELIPHIAKTGADVIYICPFYVAEDDEDRVSWSVRQTESNTNNPKNPYKMADYFNVDCEYGTNEDLKEFVAVAHDNGLLVMFDLVFLHCGRGAVFIKDNPDFVVRNENGEVWVADRWPFARLNYESKGLWEYLKKNMEYLMKEFGCDWFRCDVGDSVPLDFWKEAFGYLKTLNGELVTLNEGELPEYIEEVFDMGYDFAWNGLMIKLFSTDEPAASLKESYDAECVRYGENINKLIRTIDTHDVASDCGLNRNEIIMTSKGVEAALVITNTYDGVSFIWNGYEVCDNAENNMFSNRDYGRRNFINWSRAFTADGIRREKFIRDIHALHHNSDAIVNGKMEWLENDCPKEVVSYLKKSDKQSLLVVVNTKNRAVDVKVNANVKKVLLSSACEIGDKLKFGEYGYLVAEL